MQGQLIALQRQHAEALSKCQRLAEAAEAADTDVAMLRFNLAAAETQVLSAGESRALPA